MYTIWICNFILFLTLMSANSKLTVDDVYETFMKLEHEHEVTCLKENNLNEAMISDGISRSGVYPDNRDLKCFLNCLFLKSKAINEKGELLLDNLKERSKAVHFTFLEKFMRDCTNKIDEKDPCERAVFIDKCFTEEIKLVLSQQEK